MASISLVETEAGLIWDVDPGSPGIQDGNGNWNRSDSNWNDGTNVNTPYSFGLEPSPVAFGAGGSGTVTIGPLSGNAPQLIKVESLSFNTGSTYTINDLNGNQELFLTTGSIQVGGGARATLNTALRVGSSQAGMGLDLEKSGGGTLELADSKASTIGHFTISGGTLILNRNDNEVVSSSGMTINNGSVVQLGNGHLRNINDSASITISSGTFDLNGKSEVIGSLKLVSGSVTGPGTLTANGGFSVESGTITATLAGGGSAALEKKGAGTVILQSSGANAYGGGTTLTAGTLKLGSSGALSTVGTIRFNGGILELNNQVIPSSGLLGQLMLLQDSKLLLDPNGAAGSIIFSTALRTAGAILTISGWSATGTGRDSFFVNSDPGSGFLSGLTFRDGNDNLISTAGLWNSFTHEITPDMSVVPEPTNVALGIFGGSVLAVKLGRALRKRKAIAGKQK